MKIPEIGTQMRQFAEHIQPDYPDDAARLFELADELKRRVPGLRAPVTSTPMTSDLAQEIRDYVEEHPGLSHQAIAEHFNVNHGRVSEALHGKRR